MEAQNFNHVATANTNDLLLADTNTKQFVTMEVAGQLFGIPVLSVQDVLKSQPITTIPLAATHVLGVINLRGRIVTVLDMRKRMNLQDRDEGTHHMQVVVHHQDELYSLVVDKVGDVIKLSMSDFQSNPANLSNEWRDVSLGVYRLKERILVVLDIERLLKQAS